MNTRKWLIVSAFLVLCITLGITQASAAYVPIYTGNNNFTMLDPSGAVAGGTNDVTFTWDGTLKTAVAAALQVSNATIASSCPFNGFTWKAHDVAIYGPGTYTVKASCAARAPGCATGTNPITFTVGPDEIGVHILFDWGAVTTNKNIDVVNVWKKNVMFGPSPLFTGACGSNPANKVWDLMSKDPGTGINGYPMVDGGFVGFRANFNMMGAPINRPEFSNNNFTMNQPDGVAFGGTNDVRFTWDGTTKYAVAASGQVSNASVSSPCAFFGQPWWAHDMVVYGPGTYSVYTDCPAGSPGCGLGVPYTFTVKPGETGAHMLFYWNGNDNIDVVNVWKMGSYDQGVGPTCSSAAMWTGACGAGDSARIWDFMSYDWDGDCVNGAAMVDGPFQGMNANFNLTSCCIDGCYCLPSYDDGNPCTNDSCDWTALPWGQPCPGLHTPVNCDDSNACTADSCNMATGCVHTPISCDDGNRCTVDSCDPTRGCVHNWLSCPAFSLCTTDGICDPATGACVFPPIDCSDNNVCTTDTCDSATGNCIHTPAAVCVDTSNNNFTTIGPDGITMGGTNDVRFTWDKTRKTSVAVSGQVANATLSSACPFFGLPWTTHDMAIYGPGTYTVYRDCPAKSPGCGAGTPITFTVGPNEIAGHILLDWSSSKDIDVVNVWTPKAVFGPSTLWTGACGSNPADKVWDWMSKDYLGYGINGGLTGDNFGATNTGFNLMETANPCAGVVCNDNNACTTDTCNTATGACVYSAKNCNDNNACTTESCNPAVGCVYTPVICITGFCDPVYGCCIDGLDPRCNDNNACTIDTLDCFGTGACGHALINCNDNNACTTDSCDPATGCVHTAINCNDNNACTTETCNTAIGCVFTPIITNDYNACTIETCNPATGVIITPKNCNDNNACTADTCNSTTGACINTPIVCNDNNACTIDTCSPATGCLYTAVNCNDNNACTADSCNPATGCVYTPISADDHNACTIETCNPATGVIITPKNCNDNNACTADSCNSTTGACVNIPIVCDDNNACTTDSCDAAIGVCVYTPVAEGTVCTLNSQVGTCKAGACIVAPVCNGVKSATIRGGGQKPGSVDLQIQTNFTVVNGGCIVGSTASTVTCTPGTNLLVNVKAGRGPMPTSCTWKGAPISTDNQLTIVCPTASGDVGKLICDNKLGGGKDSDKMTITVP